MDHNTLTDLFFIIQAESVYCAVRADSLYTTGYVLFLWVKSHTEAYTLSHIQKPIRYLHTNITVGSSYSEGYSGQNTQQMFLLSQSTQVHYLLCKNPPRHPFTSSSIYKSCLNPPLHFNRSISIVSLHI